GVNPLIVGAPPAVDTTKALRVADPLGVVTPTVYEFGASPVGTVVTSCVGVADVTDAATPPNVTVFCAGVVLNPVPTIVTVVPIGPVFGAKSPIATPTAPGRSIARMLPTASYR